MKRAALARFALYSQHVTGLLPNGRGNFDVRSSRPVGEATMLRITVLYNRESVTFQLEGKLAGPWVRELERCWQDSQARRGLRVDLTSLTFIDAAGKALLAAMHA